MSPREMLLELCEQRVRIRRLECGEWAVLYSPHTQPERWHQQTHPYKNEAIQRALLSAQEIIFNGYADSPHTPTQRAQAAKVGRLI